MKVSKIKTEVFYSTMIEWFDGHNFPRVSPSMLPEFTFVYYNDSDNPMYSVCFYNTDSNLAWLGFPLSNPTASNEEKKGGFKELFNGVERYANHVGYHFLFTTSNTKSVERLLNKEGYQVGDTNVNHYVKVLK